MRRRPTLPALAAPVALGLGLAVAAAGCEPEPCPKDTVLRQADTPCTCDGAIVDEVACGALVCTAHGLVGITGLSDTGCGSTSTTPTTP